MRYEISRVLNPPLQFETNLPESISFLSAFHIFRMCSFPGMCKALTQIKCTEPW